MYLFNFLNLFHLLIYIYIYLEYMLQKGFWISPQTCQRVMWGEAEPLRLARDVSGCAHWSFSCETWTVDLEHGQNDAILRQNVWKNSFLTFAVGSVLFPEVGMVRLSLANHVPLELWNNCSDHVAICRQPFPLQKGAVNRAYVNVFVLFGNQSVWMFLHVFALLVQNIYRWS